MTINSLDSIRQFAGGFGQDGERNGVALAGSQLDQIGETGDFGAGGFCAIDTFDQALRVVQTAPGEHQIGQ